MIPETEEIKSRYKRRQLLQGNLYDPTRIDVCLARQEKERSLIKWIKTSGVISLKKCKLLEVGCGMGMNLLQFIQLGFLPENLTGNELLSERISAAQNVLPDAINILSGDASTLNLPQSAYDIVYQSTVFSSILDDEFQMKLAKKMWELVKPGGGVLWYDFIYNNPSNPDVKAVPVTRIRQLFPEGKLTMWRLTLAPPISRRVCALHPVLYHLFNAFPFLRTHVLCWIQKSKITMPK